jgi:hypothetical protein
MTGKAIKPELENHLCGPRRPAVLALDIGEPLVEAADVEENASEFGSDEVECLAHAPARIEHRVGATCSGAARAAAVLRHRRGPIRRDAGHELRAGKIRAQPLAGLHLDRLDQRPAVAAFAARKPRKRTLGRIDHDGEAARGGLDLFVQKVKMLAEERVDRPPARVNLARNMGPSSRRDCERPIGATNGEIGSQQVSGIDGPRRQEIGPLRGRSRKFGE